MVLDVNEDGLSRIESRVSTLWSLLKKHSGTETTLGKRCSKAKSKISQRPSSCAFEG